MKEECKKVKNKLVRIKVDKVTERIRYVCDFVFKARGIEHTFVLEGSSDFDYTTDNNAAELLYSEALVRRPHFNEEIGVYAIDGKEDYLAAIFYVLTRMEEYTATEKDHHDRFTANQSELKAYGLLDKAICDRWAEKILSEVGVEVQDQPIGFEPTFDIDNTYAYRYKRGIRRKLSVMRDRIRNNKKRIQERKEVEKGGKDPYDTFDIITEIAQKFNPRIFWLVESHGKYDRNLNIQLPEHQLLIEDLSKNIPIGIHPSYKSFCSPTMVKKERETLEEIIDSEIHHSRQHFLRFTLPESYRTLIKAGIQHDYSMGFADEVGFRAGTARSFPWYDLLEESITDLMIHPFVYMDGTLNEYLQLSTEEAKNQIASLYKEVEKYGGTFRFIWHNETIGEYNHWKGWRSVLDYTLSLYHE